MANGLATDAPWSDRKKWWMDVLKSTVGFLVGGLITSLFLSRCDSQRQRNTFTWQAWYGLRVAAMGDFARTSATFSVNSFNAIHTKACQRPPAAALAACVLGDRASTTILDWRGKQLDDVEVAIHALSGAFSQADPATLAKVGKEIATLHAARNDLVDLFNRAGQDACEDPGWSKLTDGKLKDAREKYDATAEAILGDLRAQLGSAQ